MYQFLKSPTVIVGGVLCALLLMVDPVSAAETTHAASKQFPIMGIPIEFYLFAATLLCVALFHHHVLPIAVTGVTVVTLTKLVLGLGFGHNHTPGIDGFIEHLGAEWVTIANLFCLLLGFEILSCHFSDTKIPEILPSYLPNGWWGSFALLVLVFFLSSFLDNIAAAMIGGSIAGTVFKGKVHIGYLAAIVAASNAGGAGSVVGDTTTTMIWIAGKSPLDVLEAFIGSAVALVIFGSIASSQQHKYQPIQSEATPGLKVKYNYLLAVVVILASAIAANVVSNNYYPAYAESMPWIGLAVWGAIILMSPIAHPHLAGIPGAFKGSIFLLSLVLSASMMPVEELPSPSTQTALTLGFVSAVFDNIPLTKLALQQGGYDWGFLAFAVGFGGSMIWFGSSAGVALSNKFPEAKSVGKWLANGWHVAIAYVVGFAAMHFILGWHPERHTKHKPEQNHTQSHDEKAEGHEMKPQVNTPDGDHKEMKEEPKPVSAEETPKVETKEPAKEKEPVTTEEKK